MKNGLTTVGVAFPSRLMSTARAAATMPTDYARDIMRVIF